MKEGTKGNTSEEEISRVCSGCALPIFLGSPLYTCEECDQFSLHKTCAELPMKLEHHKHPHSTLALYPKVPGYNYSETCCSCAYMVDDHFCYKCDMCYFTIHTICASSDHPTEANTIQHRSHPQHPLVLLGRPALLQCDACGEEQRGYFYMCNACRFYIHQDCASFPSTVKPGDRHAHSLALSYTAPIDCQWNDAYLICRKFLRTWHWMYWCSRCRCAMHLKCAMSKIEHFMSILLPRVSSGKSDYGDTQIADIDNLNRLPPANEFVSVVGHLTTSTNYTNVVGLKEVPALIEVNHLLCHQHPLVFVDDNESSSSNSATIESFLFGPDRNYFSNVPQCDVCFRVVSPPFYCCKICNLFFHQMCSKLPSEIQHPFHPQHPLILRPYPPDNFFGIFNCKLCRTESNGICYACPACRIFLDVKCAVMPRNIIHEAHPNHVLALVGKVYPERSNNCCNKMLFYGYRCNTFDFGMHANCALYPSRALDTYDEHELKQIYDPSQGNSDEYYCEICEIQIDQRHWFYYCVECDRSFHIWCDPPDKIQNTLVNG